MKKEISSLYNLLGLCYDRYLKTYRKANNCFKKGLVIQREMMLNSGDKHQKDLAELFHNLAALYERNGRLRYSALLW